MDKQAVGKSETATRIKVKIRRLQWFNAGQDSKQVRQHCFTTELQIQSVLHVRYLAVDPKQIQMIDNIKIYCQEHQITKCKF
jgi:hypothetical protein